MDVRELVADLVFIVRSPVDGIDNAVGESAKLSGGVGVNLEFRLQMETEIARIFYREVEVVPAWIACIGDGFFIRLLDDYWDRDIISDGDIKDRALVINHYIEEISKIRLSKSH
ncbi:hypothetical protein [Vulcanisaeta distributa]|uniref:hypothetical protein n=1 Tax=Vulcanisaeta distributa TaxID=164451 RepID=UPI0006D088D0|nr:hypothetical protein [Vulcanisaeta distributa]